MAWMLHSSHTTQWTTVMGHCESKREGQTEFVSMDRQVPLLMLLLLLLLKHWWHCAALDLLTFFSTIGTCRLCTRSTLFSQLCSCAVQWHISTVHIRRSFITPENTCVRLFSFSLRLSFCPPCPIISTTVSLIESMPISQQSSSLFSDLLLNAPSFPPSLSCFFLFNRQCQLIEKSPSFLTLSTAISDHLIYFQLSTALYTSADDADTECATFRAKYWMWLTLTTLTTLEYSKVYCSKNIRLPLLLACTVPLRIPFWRSSSSRNSSIIARNSPLGGGPIKKRKKKFNRQGPVRTERAIIKKQLH